MLAPLLDVTTPQHSPCQWPSARPLLQLVAPDGVLDRNFSLLGPGDTAVRLGGYWWRPASCLWRLNCARFMRVPGRFSRQPTGFFHTQTQYMPLSSAHSRAALPAGGRGAAEGQHALLQVLGQRPPLLPGDTSGTMTGTCSARAWPCTACRSLHLARPSGANLPCHAGSTLAAAAMQRPDLAASPQAATRCADGFTPAFPPDPPGRACWPPSTWFAARTCWRGESWLCAGRRTC